MKNPSASHIKFVVLGAAFFCAISRAAAAPQTQSALTLLEPGGARAAALAESFSAVTNDITAMVYNPASLATLERGAFSVSYFEGAFADRFGQALVGMPAGAGRLGVALGYYSTGDFSVYDGTNQRSVIGEQDSFLNVGYGWHTGPLSMGVSGKYFHASVAETSRATAWVGDLGLSYAMTPQFVMGGALQNFGTQLRYSTRSEQMPRSGRAGVAYHFSKMRAPLSLFGDITHAADTGENHLGTGAEVRYGVLALRAGYSTGHNDRFSVGTGFLVGNWSLDYSIGLISDLNSVHRLSLSSFFGGSSIQAASPSASPAISSTPRKREPTEIKVDRKPVEYKLNVIVAPPGAPFVPTPIGGQDRKRKIYVVQPGETLRSIAKREYGREDLWRIIASANSHLGISDDVQPGTSLVIPESSQ